MTLCTRCKSEDIVCLCRNCRRQMREGVVVMSPERAAMIAEDVGRSYPESVFVPVPDEGIRLDEGERIDQAKLDMIVTQVAADMARHTAAVIAARILLDGEDDDGET